jgi:cytochrome oxidase Cu insertion factor (SCO1/SenC/PrrC family)
MHGTDDYMMDHSTYTYLMGRDGLYLQHFRHDEDTNEMVKKIKDSLSL